MKTKICKKCGQILSIDNFPRKKYKSGNVGIQGICKVCINARRREKYIPIISENDELHKEGKRRCKTCSVIKPLSDYGTYTAGKGGVKGICKKCNGIRCRDWKRENADRINEERRSRTANDPEHREHINGKKKDWRHNNREHYLKTEAEGARRRYHENPETRQKRLDDSKHFYQNRSDEQKQKDLERNRLKNREPDVVKYKAEWSKRNYDENRQYLIDKLGGQCVRCGATEKLEFDHINPLDKSLNVSNKLTLKNAYQLEELIEEVDKCQLLCEDCHRKKTHTVDRPAINQKVRNTWDKKRLVDTI
jgi:5-methylcytosine-specific restriction endonuclease McrA